MLGGRLQQAEVVSAQNPPTPEMVVQMMLVEGFYVGRRHDENVENIVGLTQIDNSTWSMTTHVGHEHGQTTTTREVKESWSYRSIPRRTRSAQDLTRMWVR